MDTDLKRIVIRDKENNLLETDYYASRNGDVIRNGKIRKTHLGTNGYLTVGIHYKGDGSATTKSVHRLIANAFVPNPDNKREVNHINGIKTDNRAENLEWVTPSENSLHAYKNGLSKPTIKYALEGARAKRDKLIAFRSKRFLGSHNPHALLKEEHVVQIREKYKVGYKVKQLAQEYNVSRQCIGLIVHYINWKHIQ